MKRVWKPQQILDLLPPVWQVRRLIHALGNGVGTPGERAVATNADDTRAISVVAHRDSEDGDEDLGVESEGGDEGAHGLPAASKNVKAGNLNVDASEVSVEGVIDLGIHCATRPRKASKDWLLSPLKGLVSRPMRSTQGTSNGPPPPPQLPASRPTITRIEASWYRKSLS